MDEPPVCVYCKKGTTPERLVSGYVEVATGRISMPASDAPGAALGRSRPTLSSIVRRWSLAFLNGWPNGTRSTRSSSACLRNTGQSHAHARRGRPLTTLEFGQLSRRRYELGAGRPATQQMGRSRRPGPHSALAHRSICSRPRKGPFAPREAKQRQPRSPRPSSERRA